MGLVDYEPLLNPKRGIPPWAERAVDLLSWGLPAIAAICSIGSGVAAWRGADTWAAGLGIAGGVVGALGVVFTNWASRIRDGRLAAARNLGALGVDMANDALERFPPEF
jgi:hypothetical protein